MPWKKLLWRHGQVTAWHLEKRIQVIALDHAKVQPVEQTNIKQNVGGWDHMLCSYTVYIVGNEKFLKTIFYLQSKKTGLHFLKSNFSSRSWFFRKKCFSVCQHFLLSIISFWLCITCKAHKFLCFEYAHLLRFALLKRILQELMNMSFAYSYRQIVIYKCFVCYQYVFSSLTKVLIQHFFALLIATIRTF